MRASTRTSGFSIVAVQLGHALRRRGGSRIGSTRWWTASASRPADVAGSAWVPSRSSWPLAAGSSARRGEAGVALDEVRQLVARSRPGREVGGDGGVELEPVERRCPCVSSDRISGLASCAAHGGGRRARRRRPASARWSAGIHVTAAAVAVGHDGQPEQRRRGPARRPTTAATSTAADRRRAAAADAAGDSLAVTSATSCSRSSADSTDGGRAERLGQPLGERAELEEVEQPPDLVGVRRHHAATRAARPARRGAGSSPGGSCGCAPRARPARPAASASARRRWRRCRRARRTC